MCSDQYKQGSFTLPGEAGYEALTLELAKRWGADTIRDSDGTRLSEEIISMGYDIYSTLCLVRSDNAWAKANMDKLQQNFLMSFPIVAEHTTVIIDPLQGYFREQFVIDSRDDSIEWWQVFDRTTGIEVPVTQWRYDPGAGTVRIENAMRWHTYTVNFLVFRIWEEISMYNHITNHWGDREHLMAIEPMHPEAQEHILQFLEEWLQEHPKTDVVRFTSLFYNFSWYWGDDPHLRCIYSDWGSYDFAVNTLALNEFAEVKGYRLNSEDFVNNGRYNSTHNVPTRRYRDWMDFVNQFVVRFGSKCIERVHRYGKKAFVFYDDHWIGIEPYGERFKDFHFDGIIKCVFNAFEARLCAGVTDVGTRELRLHPYLFPTGLAGEPTFQEGGNPTLDAKKYWVNVRRALLRSPVDRIGLGGYLHLVRDFPDFIDYMEALVREFRVLKSFHENGKPYTVPCRVAILTAWGKLRSWSCSGHMHEHPELELIRVIESLAGLPVDVEFISFGDIVKTGIPDDINVIINAGRLDSAWQGGSYWRSPEVVSIITEWVARGGGFIGIGEPTAARYGGRYFQLAHILGVDREIGLSICKMKYAFKNEKDTHFIMEDMDGEADFDTDIDNVFVTGGSPRVLQAKGGSPRIVVNDFGKGRSVYLSGFKCIPENTRLLHRAVCWSAGCEGKFTAWTCSNVHTECAYYPECGALVIINNSGNIEHTTVTDHGGKRYDFTLKPHGMMTIDL